MDGLGPSKMKRSREVVPSCGGGGGCRASLAARQHKALGWEGPTEVMRKGWAARVVRTGWRSSSNLTRASLTSGELGSLTHPSPVRRATARCSGDSPAGRVTQPCPRRDFSWEYAHGRI
jgi:hypothetical protein